MGEPIRKLSPQLVQDHPPLRSFTQFIEQKSGKTPDPAAIRVQNDQPNDGNLDLNFFQDGQLFLGRLNGHEGILQLHHGKIVKGKPQWEERVPFRQNVAGACGTVHALGGTLEEGTECRDTPAVKGLDNDGFRFALALGVYPELHSWWGYRTSFYKKLLREFPAGFKFTEGAAPLLGQRIRHFSATGLGALAMFAADRGADALGLHPRYERHERWGLSVGAGYGTYRLAHGLLHRFGRRPGIKPVGLGTSLLSSALVDGTVGQFFEEASWERHLLRSSAFFLPQVIKTYAGQRTLNLAQATGFRGMPKVLGGVFLGGLLLDATYMVQLHGTRGHAEAMRRNRIYQRAYELQDEEPNVENVLRGWVHLIAPAITERFLTSDRFVQKSRKEIGDQALQYLTEIENGLRRHLHAGIVRPATAADWDGLQGDNRLEDLILPNGKRLPVKAVAEQLADPRISQKLSGESEEEILGYIRRQFRGHRLTESHAREILDRISLYQTRRQIQELWELEGGANHAIQGFFDRQGRMIPGQEQACLDCLFGPSTPGIPIASIGLSRLPG